jgi:DNA ligase (NAD+)
LDFLIDGAVFKVNDLRRVKNGVYREIPRWALAYKFLALEKTNNIEDVVWQVSRTSKLNPLAILNLSN